MIKSHYQIDTCRLCGGRDPECVLKLTPTPLADSYVSLNSLQHEQERFPIDLHLCRKCGFLQLHDVVYPEGIYLDYIYQTSSSLGLVEHFRKAAEKMADVLKPPKGSLVVDIGSNDGSLLKCFKEKGMKVLGIEPAQDIAQEANKSGIKTIATFFDEELGIKLRNERGLANIITANNLFANIDDLNDFTKGVRNLLAPNGVFVFETFYLLDLMQNMVFDFIYHEHLSYFTLKPLRKFFRSHDMELIDVERIPIKGGSIRCTVQLADGLRNESASVKQMDELETEIGIHNTDYFKVFESRINNAKQQLLNLLRDLKDSGKSIVGYGASATTTTLIYHFEIMKILDFIVDDNLAKNNLYSPGCHIPVFSSQEIYKRKADYVIILAWRYTDPIIRKHKAYLEHGGHFIIPLPTLEII